tara:strand:+ start:640 stop:1413 length:774 start_codon:yes stop_codon:yes gene_type:complete
MNKNIVYDQEFTDMLSHLYNKWIKKCLNGQYKCTPWWNLDIKTQNMKEFKEKTPFIKGNINTFGHSCGKNALMHKIAYGDDPITFEAFYDTINWKIKNKRFMSDTYMHRFWQHIIPKLVEIISNYSEVRVDDLRSSNSPKIYKKWNGREGFMGWHTNADKPGYRWYLVYNTRDKASCTKWYNPEKEDFNIVWEPKGWSLNAFKLGGLDSPQWHCIHTRATRFSFGFKPDFPGPDAFTLNSDSEQIKYFNSETLYGKS